MLPVDVTEPYLTKKSPVLNTMANSPDNTPAQIINGETRKKVGLGKGFSLMDWIRKSKDISNEGSTTRVISHEELVKHNKVDDCWMVIYDKVYNVTPYLKFHPGGVDELMKGAGIDATELFNEVHPWVNYQSMLGKCLIGNYAKTAKRMASKSQLELPKPSATLQIPSLGSKIDQIKIFQDKSATPSLDSYQTLDKAFIIIYTKYTQILNEYVIIDKNEEINQLRIKVYLFDNIYEYKLDLPARVGNDYKVKTFKDGKIEIGLSKEKVENWKEIPGSLRYEANVIKKNHAVTYHTCELIDKRSVTHDTDIYTFKLPETCLMCIPLGHHVYMRFIDDQTAVKPYTVINDSLFEMSDGEIKGKLLNIMIKTYENGYFTPILKKMKIGSKIEISDYTGSFGIERLQACQELVCLSAGTGFTPMIKLLYQALEKQDEQPSQVSLLFFNKTSKDILWQTQLDEFQTKHKKRLKYVNILSEPENSWKGKTGRISKSLLDELLGKHLLNKPLFCICGPIEFTKTTVSLLNQLGYTDDTIHAFSS